jgi:hypothetical protein
MTTEDPINNMSEDSADKSLPQSSDGKIQKLQKKVLRGQQLTQQETEYLASHATAGVISFLKQKFPNADINKIILTYATEELKGQDITDKMVMAVCYEIQFGFDKFKDWVRSNKRRFSNT